MRCYCYVEENKRQKVFSTKYLLTKSIWIINLLESKLFAVNMDLFQNGEHEHWQKMFFFPRFQFPLSVSRKVSRCTAWPRWRQLTSLATSSQTLRTLRSGKRTTPKSPELHWPGLPDGLLTNQKILFVYIMEGLGMEKNCYKLHIAIRNI
jgi:hypothetical protein